MSVIDPQKEAKVQVGPDGKFAFGDPALFTMGLLARERIVEVIKSDGKARQGDTIGGFIYGFYRSDRPHFAAKGERLVLLLRLLDASGKEFNGAVVQRIDQAAPIRERVKRDKFDPRGCYTPVQEGFAQVLVQPDKLELVDKIKLAIAKHP